MGVFFGDKHYSTVNTTPESYDIQKYLREMVNDGVEYFVMEVSSQALKVGRVFLSLYACLAEVRFFLNSFCSSNIS